LTQRTPDAAPTLEPSAAIRPGPSIDTPSGHRRLLRPSRSNLER
jgi:hypothetical protein